MALSNMSRTQLQNFVERNREKAEKAATNALHLGEFAVGAIGSSFWRAKYGMPKLFGRDANMVLGAAGVAYGLLMGSQKFATDAMYLGAGMLTETMLDWGRSLGTPKKDKGGAIYSGAYQLPEHTHAHSYTDTHHHASAGGPVADLGMASIIEARRSYGIVPLRLLQSQKGNMTMSDLSRILGVGGQRLDTVGSDDSGAIYTGDLYSAGDEYSGDDMGDDMGDDAGDLIGELVSGIVGDDVGARRRKRAVKLEPRRMPGKLVAFEPFKARAWRKMPLGGFKKTILAANPVDTVSNQPQLPFRVERLVVPSNIGVDFDVIDVLVGNQSQFVAAGNVPGLTFSEQGFQVELKGDTAYISQTVTIRVQNNTAVDKVFSATIIGHAMKGE